MNYIKSLEAENERLREEVVTLATVGDFSGLRPNDDVFKQVVRIKRTGVYQQQPRPEKKP